MNTYLNYMIEANMGLLLFTMIYFLLFEKETQFTFKRLYLLSAIIVSLVFPLIEFNTSQPVIPSISSVVPLTYLPEEAVNELPSTPTPSPINYWDMASGFYGFVAGILLILFLIRAVKLVMYLNASAFEQVGKFRVIESNANHPTFSFFYYIFIGNAHQVAQSEKEQIINHEKLHASRMHSLDLLVSEVLKIAFWFNPIVYVLKNQLVSIHEFEADQQALQHQDVDQYCELLARGSLASAGFSLVNHFHNSLTLKRIAMINTEKTKIKNWKYLVLIPVFSAAFLMASGQDQLNAVYTTVDEPPAAKNWGEYAKFIQRNIEYPAEARKAREQGEVITAIVVEKDGTITNHQIVQSVSPSLDAEALRIVRLLPPWNPGKDKGVAVRMKILIPIEFRFDGIEKPITTSPEPAGVKISKVTIFGYASDL